MSRIARVEVLMVDLVPKVKRVDAIQSFVSQETPIVRITDADGVVGTGYSYTIGTGGHSVIELLKRTLVPAIIGRDAHEIEAIWRDTTEGVWLHLEESALVEDALRAKAEGFGGCKLKVGRPIHEDVRRIAAVREAVGPGFEIFTDANQRFNVDEAIRRARAYEPLDIGWFEEQLTADDVSGHTRLAGHTSIPIAVGESLYSLLHFREYLERHACSIIQVDVGRIGGITPWLKVAHMAEAFNIAVCPHFLMELHVALCAAVPNGRWVEYIPQLDITGDKMKIEAGRAVPWNTPGLGIDWDIDAITAMTVEGSHSVHL